MPNRNQLEFRATGLESLLPEGHRARPAWAHVRRADLEPIYAGIRAVVGGSGHPAIAPEILFAPWPYATIEGVGSARAVARLTESEDAYRRICGGARVDYRALSDCRVDRGETLDALLADSVAALLAAEAAKLERVAQDGMRVRAGAGAASFRRRGTLERHLEDAREQVAALEAEIDVDPGALSRKQRAARTRAAREREAKIQKAPNRLPELEEIEVRQGKKPEGARASTTDDRATVTKMAAGGYRPAYDARFAADTESQAIVGVEVVTAGSDMARLEPTVEQVAERYGQTPEAWLVDGGFPAHEQPDAVAERAIVYAPVPKPKDPATDPHLPKPKDGEAVAERRQRVGTDEAKAIYEERAATAECANAQARNRGLRQFRVRGPDKVRRVLLFRALAHDLLRTFAVAPELLGLGTGMPATGALAA